MFKYKIETVVKYNEDQLTNFARPPFKYEREQVVRSHEAVRGAIQQHFEANYEYEVFLQGSYKNDTNVRRSSDVDVVVKLNNVFRGNIDNLPDIEKEKYNGSFSNSDYGFEHFNLDILRALTSYFGAKYVTNDNKCIKIKEHKNYCDTDVIPSLSYRVYSSFKNQNNNQYTEGIYFNTNNGISVINFPKQHYESLTNKSALTKGNFKETVRMFKSMKNVLIDDGLLFDDKVKSYFIENLLFNVPNRYFANSYVSRFTEIVSWLIKEYNSNRLASMKCANGIDFLVSEKNWKIENVRTYLETINGLTQ